MICECGCGGVLPRGLYKGRARRFLHGHNRRGRRIPDPVEQDRGYRTLCLIWQGAVGSGGYGITGRRGQAAHVEAWERVHGPVPAGRELDHLCRVRCCVNPEHLQAVTRLEHARRGSAVKLSVERVREIRRRYAAGADRRQLATEFGIAACTVSNVAARRVWAEV